MEYSFVGNAAPASLLIVIDGGERAGGAEKMVSNKVSDKGKRGDKNSVI